jgi:hypothetical protein
MALSERCIFDDAGVQVVRLQTPKLSGPGMSVRYHLVIDKVRRRVYLKHQTALAFARRLVKRRILRGDISQAPRSLAAQLTPFLAPGREDLLWPGALPTNHATMLRLLRREMER